MQSAMVSTISNDVFRNKLKMIWVRGLVVLVMVPSIVLAVKVADDILQIYLIADLVSAAIIPSIFLGLSDRAFWFLRGIDVMVGGLGSLFGVFVFGWIYYDSAQEGGKLMLIWNGLYNPEDWGPFGAFTVTFCGGVIFALMFAAVRIGALYVYAMVTKSEFTALERKETMYDVDPSHEIPSADDSSIKKASLQDA